MNNTSSNRESETTQSPAVHLLPCEEPNVEDISPRQISLSSTQELALEWLTNGGSITEAAQFAGVTRQTVTRWLRTDEDFQAVYTAWREEAAAIVQGRMIAASESAMDNILDAIRRKGDLRASQFVLKSLTAARSNQRR